MLHRVEDIHCTDIRYPAEPGPSRSAPSPMPARREAHLHPPPLLVLDLDKYVPTRFVPTIHLHPHPSQSNLSNPTRSRSIDPILPFFLPRCHTILSTLTASKRRPPGSVRCTSFVPILLLNQSIQTSIHRDANNLLCLMVVCEVEAGILFDLDADMIYTLFAFFPFNSSDSST